MLTRYLKIDICRETFSPNIKIYNHFIIICIVYRFRFWITEVFRSEPISLFFFHIVMSLLAFFVIPLSFATIPEIPLKRIDKVLKESPSLVLFYMEDDPLSEKLSQALEEASDKLEALGVPIGKFNCLDGPEKCKKAQIQEIPDIKFIRFVNHQFSSYIYICIQQRK